MVFIGHLANKQLTLSNYPSKEGMDMIVTKLSMNTTRRSTRMKMSMTMRTMKMRKRMEELPLK